MSKIMLVEDNEMNRDILSRRLERRGCAADGPTCVAMALAEQADLIPMDMRLGHQMDGWEATRLIKADPATTAIPIIALTGHVLASDREMAMRIGCVDFATKSV